MVPESNTATVGTFVPLFMTVTTGNQVDAIVYGTVMATGTRVGASVELEGSGAGTDV